jgi:hypothetical protein
MKKELPVVVAVGIKVYKACIQSKWRPLKKNPLKSFDAVLLMRVNEVSSQTALLAPTMESLADLNCV